MRDEPRARSDGAARRSAAIAKWMPSERPSAHQPGRASTSSPRLTRSKAATKARVAVEQHERGAGSASALLAAGCLGEGCAPRARSGFLRLGVARRAARRRRADALLVLAEHDCRRSAAALERRQAAGREVEAVEVQLARPACGGERDAIVRSSVVLPVPRAVDEQAALALEVEVERRWRWRAGSSTRPTHATASSASGSSSAASGDDGSSAGSHGDGCGAIRRRRGLVDGADELAGGRSTRPSGRAPSRGSGAAGRRSGLAQRDARPVARAA